jgi:hypothetical protein
MSIPTDFYKNKRKPFTVAQLTDRSWCQRACRFNAGISSLRYLRSDNEAQFRSDVVPQVSLDGQREAREQLLFLGGDVFLVTPLTEKVVTLSVPPCGMNWNLFLGSNSTIISKNYLDIMAILFLENLGIFRIWRNNPISGTPMFSSMMPSQIESCVHTNYISNCCLTGHFELMANCKILILFLKKFVQNWKLTFFDENKFCSNFFSKI